MVCSGADVRAFGVLEIPGFKQLRLLDKYISYLTKAESIRWYSDRNDMRRVPIQPVNRSTLAAKSMESSLHWEL